MSGAKAFQLVAIAYGLAGMAWGLKMGISGDHAMMPAHAHLNLLGWVSLSVMAAYYRHAGTRARAGLLWSNFLASSLGALIFAVALALRLSGVEQAEAGIAVGALLSMLGLLLFGLAVLRTAD